MSLTLRPGRPEDATMCGTICYEAFKTIAEQHNFPTNYPSPEVAIERMAARMTHPRFYSVVAELDGCIVGSNFLDERSTVAGLGPISIHPELQNATIGRRLMLAALERATERRFPGVRLLQAAYHNRSLSLYTKLGFNVREPVVTLQGPSIKETIAGYAVRKASEDDL